MHTATGFFTLYFVSVIMLKMYGETNNLTIILWATLITLIAAVLDGTIIGRPDDRKRSK